MVKFFDHYCSVEPFMIVKDLTFGELFLFWDSFKEPFHSCDVHANWPLIIDHHSVNLSLWLLDF